MKVKLFDIINTRESYTKLLDESYLPILIRRSLSKDAPRVIEEINLFDKLNRELILKYGKKSEDGQSIVVPQGTPNFLEYRREINELTGVEIELLTEKIPEELMNKNEKCSLNARDFIVLRGIFTEPEKEEKVDVKNDVKENIEGKE